MKRKAFLILALLPTVLAGCIAPRPPPPSAAALNGVPAAWWRGSPSTAEATIDRTWWRGLGDVELDGLIDRALIYNTDIGVAAARVAEARALAGGARAARLTEIDGETRGDYGRTVTLGKPVVALGGSTDILANWDIDLFGRLAKADAATRASLLSSQAARASVMLAVASSIAQSYVELLAADRRLALLRLTLASRLGALTVARRLTESGYSSQLELREAESEYAATAQLIPQAELQIAKLEDSLSTLSGDPPRKIARSYLGLGAIRMPTIPGGLPSALLHRRPDIVSAENALIAADSSLDSERAAMLPDFSLTASGGGVYANTLPTPLSTFNLAGSVLAPLFDAGRRRARADAAGARRDSAAFAYRAAVLTAFREVEDRLAGIALLDARATSLADQVTANDDRLRIVAKRREIGYATSLDRLDAQRQLLAAELSLVDANADRLVNYIALYQALGGGWSDEREP